MPYVSVVLLVLVATAGWLALRLSRVLAIGSAYKAKVLGTLIFGTDRAIDPAREDEVASDSYRLLRIFRAHVDTTARVVTVSCFGLRARSAIYRDGYGATLAQPHDPPSPMPAMAPHVATLSGGWQQAQGSARLAALVRDAFGEPNPKRLRRTKAIVVVHDGRIIAEEYARGFRETTRCVGWSMTKSVTGALVGILAGEGRLALHDSAVMSEWRAPDPRAAITVEDLLRMRSGLKFSEVYSDFSSDVIEMLFAQRDTAAYAARQPLVSAPGTTWSYAGGTTNILSSLIRRIVGDREYPLFPRRALFDRLGMASAILEPDASGTFVGSSFMLATARDWARFGQLYLQDGRWDGQQILPDGWVDFSTTPTPQSPDGIFGAHWWLKLGPELGGATREAAHIAPDAFFAIGHEGQTLTVIPSLRLVVVRLGVSIHIDAWDHAAFSAAVQDALP